MTDLTLQQPDMRSELPKVGSATEDTAIAEAQAQAITEVKAKVLIAHQYPRDELRVVSGVERSCSSRALAERAVYSFPRDKTKIEGPSIKLISEIARHWGNLDYGSKIIKEEKEYVSMFAYAWDLETNLYRSQQFRVSFYRFYKNGTKKLLEDERDRYEMMANKASRRIRKCLEDVLPDYIIEHAMERCDETIKSGMKGSPEMEIKKAVEAFRRLKVTQKAIERYFGCEIMELTAQNIVELRKIWNAISEGDESPGAYFDIAQAKAPDVENEKPKAQNKGEEKKKAETATDDAQPPKEQEQQNVSDEVKSGPKGADGTDDMLAAFGGE